jgi:hypothetical protein
VSSFAIDFASAPLVVSVPLSDDKTRRTFVTAPDDVNAPLKNFCDCFASAPAVDSVALNALVTDFDSAPLDVNAPLTCLLTALVSTPDDDSDPLTVIRFAVPDVGRFGPHATLLYRGCGRR